MKSNLITRLPSSCRGFADAEKLGIRSLMADFSPRRRLVVIFIVLSFVQNEGRMLTEEKGFLK